MTILHQPEEISTVRNPIALVVQSTAAVVYLRLKVESALYADDFEQRQILLDSSPDAAQRCEFYLHNALRSQLDYDAPNLSAAVFCTQLCKRYIIELAELEADEIFEDAVWQPLPAKYAILSGFERQNFPARTSPVPTRSNTLDHRPQTRYVAAQGPDFITFLFPSDTNLTVRYFVDSDDVTAGYGTARKWQPVHVPIGAAQIGFSGSHSVVQLFRNSSLIANCAVRRGEAEMVLLYYNTAGGLCGLPVFGQIQADTEVEVDVFRHYQPYNYAPTMPVMRRYNREKFGVYSLRTGHFGTLEELAAAAEIVQSEALWLWRPDKPLTPVMLTTNRVSYYNKYDPLQGLALEVRDAFVG